MPDILYVPAAATQSEICDCLDRLRLGDMLCIEGRVVGLIAYSTAALTGNNQTCDDRRYFALIDSLLADPQSPVRTPGAAARYIVQQGIVPGDAAAETKAQRIAKNYRRDRKLSREKKSEIGRNAVKARWAKSARCKKAAENRCADC